MLAFTSLICSNFWITSLNLDKTIFSTQDSLDASSYEIQQILLVPSNEDTRDKMKFLYTHVKGNEFIKYSQNEESKFGL